LKVEAATQLEFANGSRIVSLPGKEANIRSFQGVTLLVLDEAARVADDLYASVSPMTAIARGQQVALSTPFGQRGWWWREWHDAKAPWVRFRVPWQRCPRHTQAFIDEETRKFGQMWVEQEYECSFTAMEGLVYPDFHQCVTNLFPLMEMKYATRFVGGLDWGWNNPFAAVWGFVDKDDVLYILRERYLRQTPLHEHIRALKKPRNDWDPVQRVMWYADPSGPTEIAECRAANLKVQKGNNDIRLGIMAVTARIRTGRLKVVSTGCPNLISESQLYRYPDAQERAIAGEDPVDEHNHALGALRYLISKLDHRFIGKLKKGIKAEQDGQGVGGGGGGSFPEGLSQEALEEAQAAVHGVMPREAGGEELEEEDIPEETEAERKQRIWDTPEAWS
jgi:hypothetical protein